MLTVKYLYNRLFNNGSERTIKAKKNIALLIVYKSISIAIGLVMIPMTLNYVDTGTYGVWLTLSSIVGWMSFFDIGMNNGLKNRLTISIAKGDDELGRTYVSTTYAMLTCIFIPLMAILLITAQLLDWNSMLNLDIIENRNLIKAISIIITYFCINFILSTINVIMLAHQSPAEVSLCFLIQQIISLFVIYVLTVTTNGSLLLLCTGLCVSPLVVVLLFNIILFRGKYKMLSPSINYIDFHKAPDLLKLGFKFFIIQIAAIIQFQMANFLIMRYYGAEEVTSYNIAFKYFNVLYMFWGILATPVWVAVTDAATKGDYNWIRNMQNKYLKVFIVMIIVGLMMLVVSNRIYYYWIGDKVCVPIMLSLWVFIYNIIQMFGSIFVNVLNGLGVLNIQTISSFISPLFFLTLVNFLVSQGVGVYAIMIASVLANFNGFLLAPIQCYMILKKKCTISMP